MKVGFWDGISRELQKFGIQKGRLLERSVRNGVILLRGESLFVFVCLFCTGWESSGNKPMMHKRDGDIFGYKVRKLLNYDGGHGHRRSK